MNKNFKMHLKVGPFNPCAFEMWRNNWRIREVEIKGILICDKSDWNFVVCRWKLLRERKSNYWFMLK